MAVESSTSLNVALWTSGEPCIPEDFAYAELKSQVSFYESEDIRRGSETLAEVTEVTAGLEPKFSALNVG